MQKKFHAFWPMLFYMIEEEYFVFFISKTCRQNLSSATLALLIEAAILVNIRDALAAGKLVRG